MLDLTTHFSNSGACHKMKTKCMRGEFVVMNERNIYIYIYPHYLQEASIRHTALNGTQCKDDTNNNK